MPTLPIGETSFVAADGSDDKEARFVGIDPCGPARLGGS